MILTSNKYFSGWDELLKDTVPATALLARLLHHAPVINIWGEIYRLKAGIQTASPAEIPAES